MSSHKRNSAPHGATSTFDYLMDEESLDTDLESSLTSSSSIDSNTEYPKNKLTGENINIDSKQPPIVILLNETHTALSTQALVNKQYPNAICKNNGKTLTIHVKNKIDHGNIIRLLKSGNIEFHSYQRKEGRKPRIVLKGLPLLPTDDIHEELIVIEEFHENMTSDEVLGELITRDSVIDSLLQHLIDDFLRKVYFELQEAHYAVQVY
ncbi:hypothetical protein PV328_010384 [Microctonus aethiopoides]|uniref:Uncharacterized protein n=1 Tax=Microctonus aethiopoides TaxID=144406 RepID=A0AA39FHM2_9HYME|nr:hypothetical protein PV328_010384 [Microctonus aethiopoides]